jgi:hypothetical protein
MTQTRLGSLIEAWTNTLLGAFINLGVSIVVYPLFGATFSFMQNVYLVIVFTFISVVRGYVIRRWFNQQLHKAAENLAHKIDA